MSETARRFLKPRVGVDPAEITVHRGPAASQFAAAHRADAVAVGEDIVIGASAEETSPEGLGLLAHELTHVARRRAPRFIPPVVRQAGVESGTSSARLQESTDEEPLALQVESAVRQAARFIAPHLPARSNPGPSPESLELSPSAEIGKPRAAPAVPRAPTEEPEAAPLLRLPVAHTQPTQHPWGGLPAPWEPLPELLTAPAAVPLASAGASAPVGGDPAGGPVVMTAPEDRPSGEAPSEPAFAAVPAAPPQAHGPDLDLLAGQVYSILRRRLAAERRRLG